MRPRRLLLCVLVPLLAAAAPATAAAQVPTAGTLAGEIAALADAAARQWPPLLDANGQFANPFPADLARGHGAFVPPMLVYAIQRTGERAGDPALVRVADRAWPEIIDPARASAFDMIGAAYAYRGLTLSDAPPRAARRVPGPLRHPDQRAPLPAAAALLLQPQARRRARRARDHRRRHRLARPRGAARQPGGGARGGRGRRRTSASRRWSTTPSAR